MSEIKVDKLQGTSGSDTAITLSGANATVGGTLAVTGVHTVGTNAVATSDGGATTTNIVQGLAKQWCQFEGDGTIALTDSFNVGSLTDTATGDYNLSYSTNMSNAGYSMTGGGVHDAGSLIFHITVDHDTTAFATASWQMNTMNHNNAQGDAELITCAIHGDLA